MLQTIVAIATLKHMAAPITTLRRGYHPRSATLVLDLEKHLTSIKRSINRLSDTTRHPRPAPDVAGRLPYERNLNGTISKKEVQIQPYDKWHTTRKQLASNTIQHGDQSTTTTEPW